MEKVARYQAIVQQVLEDYVTKAPSDEKVSVELSFDPQRGHYQVLHIGWHEENRIYGCVIHLNLRGDKIWVQHDGTEADITGCLLEHGVPNSDIVLGFQAPIKRPYTDFAVG